MPIPTTKVLFQFSEGAGGVTNFFTLDDPVKGILNNTTYTLGGAFSVVDVTQYVRSVAINRGRSRVLDRTQAGAATIVLDNRARLFDPTAGTAISPYSNDIVPRKNVSITVNSEPVFSGQVDDWNIDFEVNGDSTSSAICADGFLQLSAATMSTATRTSQLASARVDAVLTEIGWPSSKRTIGTAAVTLQADTPSANTNVLDYLQTVTDTEFGSFYINRIGNVEFDNRSTVQTFTATTLLGGTGIPITSVKVNIGSELLFNSVSVARNNGGTATKTDATSIAAYGESDYSRTGLLFSTDTESSTLADYLLSRYKDPTLRIEEVSVSMNALGTAQHATIASLDVTSPVQVTFSPTVGSAVTQFATIDRIAHQITPGEHVVILSMSEAQPSFILNDATFGQLDDDKLGF